MAAEGDHRKDVDKIYWVLVNAEWQGNGATTVIVEVDTKLLSRADQQS